MTVAGPSWTEILTAIGTVLAVIVALGTQGFLTLREHRRQPRLAITPDPLYTQVERGRQGHEVLYVRLSVENAPGKISAEDVMVTVSDYTRKDAPGAEALANAPLTWTHHERITMTVPPGANRTLDLGTVLNDFRSPKLALRVQPPPNDNRHILQAGSYNLGITVAGRNADATDHTFQIKIKNVWSPDCVTVQAID